MFCFNAALSQNTQAVVIEVLEKFWKPVGFQAQSSTRKPDMSFWKRAVMILTVATTMSVSTQVLAAQQYKDSRQTQATIADAVIARPLGIVVTGLGAVLFVVSLPFSALGGNIGEAADALVIKPAKETFTRCLGCTSSEQTSAVNDI
jgi:hypothetical protein